MCTTLRSGDPIADYSQTRLDHIPLELDTRLRLLHLEKVLHRPIDFTVYFSWGISPYGTTMFSNRIASIVKLRQELQK